MKEMVENDKYVDKVTTWDSLVEEPAVEEQEPAPHVFQVNIPRDKKVDHTQGRVRVIRVQDGGGKEYYLIKDVCPQFPNDIGGFDSVYLDVCLKQVEGRKYEVCGYGKISETPTSIDETPISIDVIMDKLKVILEDDHTVL